MAELEFRLPDIGEGLAEAEVVRWLVSVGESVQENQIVAQVETDKAVVDLPSPATGVVKRLPVEQGQRVKVGSVLLVLTLPDAAAAQAPARFPAEPVASPGPPAPTPQVQAAPAARKLATELGVNLAAVRGTGAGGRISVDDVRSYAKSAQTPAAGETGADSERIPVQGVRRRIAEALTQTARTVPHVCGFHEVDAAALRDAFERLKPLAADQDIRLTYLPFLIKAVALALRDHPCLNASYDEQGPSIVLHKRRNIGIAMATPDGLVVPVIRDADTLGILAIAREAVRLSAALRERRVQPAALQHSTFTISNVGGAGGWFGTSILHYPEAALLGVGRIEERAVVREGTIVIRPILPVSLTFDHRVLDGDAALAFIQQLRQLVGSEISPALLGS